MQKQLRQTLSSLLLSERVDNTRTSAVAWQAINDGNAPSIQLSGRPSSRRGRDQSHARHGPSFAPTLRTQGAMRLLAELPHTLTHAYTCARIQLRTHTLTRSYTHTRIHLRTHTLAHSYTYALIRLRTHALTHAYTWYVTCAVIRTMRTCTHDHGTSVVHDVYALLTLLEVVTQVASLQALLSLLLNVIMVYDTHQLPPTATSNR